MSLGSRTLPPATSLPVCIVLLAAGVVIVTALMHRARAITVGHARLANPTRPPGDDLF